ncbi:MAG: L-aspartate oxidase [Lysobacteraceae bacterium]|nr:MAG: L-aspartate oxidase [Xanthomonadaceae bacterium]
MSEPLCVVGAGLAGLSTALAAAPRPVLLIDRSLDPMDCATALAQGGMAAAVDPQDSPALHARDTQIAGAWRNDPLAVDWLTRSAATTVVWLESQGVHFDRIGPRYRLAREGGHSLPRVLHVGGDASGRGLLQALLRRADGQAGHIRCIRGATLIGIGLSRNRVVAVRWQRAGRIEEAGCSGLVLACGGYTALHPDSTHPSGSDGAALLLAMKAGARPRDLHYLQFHPTALHVPGREGGRMPLITEALRGCGATLCDREGRRIMLGRHPLAELAPRDVCARAVFTIQQRQGCAYLHAWHLDLDWEDRFPGVLRTCLEAGLDPRRDPIPVRAAAHYQIGGIACDLDGRTAVEGLFVAGEIASSGVHGANRLASNSLLEAASAGRRLGLALAQGATSATRAAERWVELGPPAAAEQRPKLQHIVRSGLAPIRSMRSIREGLALLEKDREGVGWQGELHRPPVARCPRRPRVLRRPLLGRAGPAATRTGRRPCLNPRPWDS